MQDYFLPSEGIDEAVIRERITRHYKTGASVTNQSLLEMLDATCPNDDCLIQCPLNLEMMLHPPKGDFGNCQPMFLCRRVNHVNCVEVDIFPITPTKNRTQRAL